MAIAQLQKPAENKLLLLVKSGSTLLSSISTYPSTTSHSLDVVEELMSIVAVTSTLLIALNSSLDQYLPAGQLDTPFVGPLYDEVAAGFEQLKKKVDKAREKNSGSIEKSLEWKPLVVGVEALGGLLEVGKLRKMLMEGRRKVGVLVEGVKLMGLRGIAEGERTAEEKCELKQLESRLPSIVENLLDVQKDFGLKLDGEYGDVEETTGELSPTKKENNDIPELSEDFEDLKSLPVKSCGAATASAASSVTVIDDWIEEAWLLRRNEPKKTLKTSTALFGINLMSSYTHEDVFSYYVNPVQSCAADIKEIRARALGNVTESEHRNDLKKMVLALDDQAQWEIQRLLESRDKASSNNNVRRLWEVVAFQPQPRRKISDMSESKWWKSGKKSPVEWLMVLRGETIDYQKRKMPVKLGDPWKPKGIAQDSTVVAPTVKSDIPTFIEKTSMTVEKAQEKIDGVLAVLFTPATDSQQSVDTNGQEVQE